MTIHEQLDRANSSETITVTEFGLLARYQPQTVYRKIKRGEIPGVVRFGRSIRIVRAVALRWVERRRPGNR